MKLISEEKKTKKELFSGIVRCILVCAEVLCFMPLCVVSCSAQEDADKAVWGLEAVFGFELSYITDKVAGIWWILFVFIITACMIVIWFFKDLKIFSDFKVKKLVLCFLTGVAAIANSVLMICFIGTVNSRVQASNEEFVLGTVSVRYTPFFIILLIIQIVLSLGGILGVLYLIVKETDQVNELIPEFKKLSKRCKEMKQKPRICMKCGCKLKKDEKFCSHCGNEYQTEIEDDVVNETDTDDTEKEVEHTQS